MAVLLAASPIHGPASASPLPPGAAAFFAQCDSLDQLDRREEILSICRARLAELRATPAADSLELATAAYWLSRILSISGRSLSEESIGNANLADGVFSRRLGPEEPAAILSALNHGSYLEAQGDHAGAGARYRQALAAAERVFPPNDPRLAIALIFQANLQTRLAQYEGVESLYDRALAIRETAFGPRDRRVANVLGNQAIFFRQVGRYGEAEAALRRSGSILQETAGPYHPNVARNWYNLSQLLRTAGRPQAAEEAAHQAVAVAIQAQGRDHPSVALYRQGLAKTLQARYDLLHAREEAEEAVRINAVSLPPESPQVGNGLAILASVLRELGDFEQAEPLLRRALLVRERELGASHPRVADIRAELGYILGFLGDTQGAIRELENALACRQATYGPEHLLVALTCSDLASIQLRAGDADAAAAHAERSLAIQRTVFGPGAHRTPGSLVALAEARRRQGRADETAELLDELDQQAEATRETPKPEFDAALQTRSRLYLDLQRPDKAIEVSVKRFSLQRTLIQSVVRGLPERQALHFLSGFTSPADLPLSVLSTVGAQPSEVESVWCALVRSRALVLDEMAARRRMAAVAPSADSAEQRLREEWAELTRELAHRTFCAPAIDTLPASPDPILALQESRERIERRLASEFGDRTKADADPSPSIRRLHEALPPGTAVISYCRYRQLDLGDGRGGRGPGAPTAEGTPSYLAFVLTAEGRLESPRLLGAADEIELRLSRWRDEAGFGATIPGRAPEEAERAYRDAGDRLREVIWDPIAPSLVGSRHVIVVPDAALALVDFAALPVGAAGYLVEADFDLHSATTERDLMTRRGTLPGGNGLLAIGAPDFDALTSEQAPPPADETSRAGEHPADPTRGASLPSCQEFSRMVFSPLPAAAREIDEILALWAQDTAHPAHPTTEPALGLVGPAAREESFKRLAPGRRVLHVASHGFFLGDDCGAPHEGGRGVGGIEPTGRPNGRRGGWENPLLLSGIALAGANDRAHCPAGAEDGILTAAEIATVDLGGANWAVLSSCASGLGRTWAGEGVLGLRRAFQIAGVRTVIMSLWSVDDEITRTWMTELYRARSRPGCLTPEAVQRADAALLAARRAAGRSTHPYYWAGFIAAGDWH